MTVSILKIEYSLRMKRLQVYKGNAEKNLFNGTALSGKRRSKYPNYFVYDKFIYSMTPPNGEKVDEFINSTLVEALKISDVI